MFDCKEHIYSMPLVTKHFCFCAHQLSKMAAILM